MGATPHARPGAMTTRFDVATAIAVLVGIAATCAASLLVALANQPYFDLLNGVIRATDAIPRALVFSSWSILVSAPFAILRPAACGLRLGDSLRSWRLVLAACVGAVLLTAIVLTVTGQTPYSDASLFVETVVVPVSEELLYRGVLLWLLVLAFRRVAPPGRVALLAILTDGLAFGCAHLANATKLDIGFVAPQAIFAVVLGLGCAALAMRTRSVLPAMVLHGVVNAVVVLI